MVFQNVIVRNDSLFGNNYTNPEFRVRQGYKEAETPNPPARRNRDFKPLGNGDFRGYPKARNSVPFNQLRNVKDLFEERHQFVIKYIRAMVAGALTGGFLAGSVHAMSKGVTEFEIRKLN